MGHLHLELPLDRSYVGVPKNENFFLEGRGALVLPAPAWCVYVTAAPSVGHAAFLGKGLHGKCDFFLGPLSLLSSIF